MGFDAQLVYEVEREKLQIVRLPAILDEDKDDIVQVVIVMVGKFKANWIRFDHVRREFVLKPSQATPLGMH